MENKINSFRVELTGWKATVFVSVIMGLAVYGAYALSDKICESFE